jgi:hypothetical protein
MRKTSEMADSSDTAVKRTASHPDLEMTRSEYIEYPTVGIGGKRPCHAWDCKNVAF